MATFKINGALTVMTFCTRALVPGIIPYAAIAAVTHRVVEEKVVLLVEFLVHEHAVSLGYLLLRRTVCIGSY